MLYRNIPKNCQTYFYKRQTQIFTTMIIVEPKACRKDWGHTIDFRTSMTDQVRLAINDPRFTRVYMEKAIVSINTDDIYICWFTSTWKFNDQTMQYKFRKYEL